MLVRPRSRCGWGFMFAPVAINLEYIAANILDVVDEVEIINYEFDEVPIEDYLKEHNPDLFGVTMSATEHTAGLDFCKRAKKYDKDIKTIVGGFHPTAVPDLMLSFDEVDMVGEGEAEMTMRELVQKGDPEGVAGIAYKDKDGKPVHNPRRPVVKDLDTLPFPARQLRKGDECAYSLKRFGLHRDQVHTSRGCFGKCTFCCEPNMSQSRQRFRRPEKVFEEIKLIYELHHKKELFVLIGDPHFMGGPRKVDQLCDMLIDADMDIEFTAMVRADMIAKHPKTVEKMVRAGVVGYCMGMESPAEDDLGTTKKGISNKIQREAVRVLRRNNAVAGGTFVCGLEGHSEEEILLVPEYARNLGMINAAFPVATPHAATEFYRGLDDRGLINEPDWGKYDQMHLVYKHDTLSKQRCEELLTRNLGRFYALDIFLDDIIAFQNRRTNGRKTTLYGAIRHFLDRMYFLMDASKEYDTIEEGPKMGRIFFEGQANPYTRKRTEAMGMHNIIDLRRVLSIIGDQTMNITVRQGGEPFVYYVLKTAKDKVHYLDICTEPPKGVTIGITLDMEDLSSKTRSTTKLVTTFMKRLLKESKWTSLMKGVVALVADRLEKGGAKHSKEKIKLPKDFFEDFCPSDGWDPKAYEKAHHGAR